MSETRNRYTIAPIDSFLNTIGQNYLYPSFKKYGVTPNILTGVGAVFIIAGIRFLFLKSPNLAALMLFISYIFDCWDGDYARRYGMTSEFGAKFDLGVTYIHII